MFSGMCYCVFMNLKRSAVAITPAVLAASLMLSSCTSETSYPADAGNDKVSDAVHLPSSLLSAVPPSTDFSRILGKDVRRISIETYENVEGSGGKTRGVDTSACAASIWSTAYGSRTPIDLRIDNYGNLSAPDTESSAFIATYPSSADAVEAYMSTLEELNKCINAPAEIEYGKAVLVTGAHSKAPNVNSTDYTVRTEKSPLPPQHCRVIFGKALNTLIGTKVCATESSDAANELYDIMVDRLYD